MTTRIHDLAAEFGISAEQLIGMLKEIDIFVRSHLSPLKPEQVAMMRARWEREKRKQKEPPTPPKRRRAAKAAEPAAVALEERPKRRRRTAAEMAVVEAEAQAEAALEAERELKAREALEATKPLEEEKPSLEERAAALFRDLPPAEVATVGTVEAQGVPASATPTACTGRRPSPAPKSSAAGPARTDTPRARARRSTFSRVRALASAASTTQESPSRCNWARTPVTPTTSRPARSPRPSSRISLPLTPAAPTRRLPSFPRQGPPPGALPLPRRPLRSSH